MFNFSPLTSQISRARPLPNKDDHPQRTLVVEGFEEGEENVSIDSVSKLFSKYGCDLGGGGSECITTNPTPVLLHYRKVNYVRIRRDTHKRFKVCIIISMGFGNN